MSKLIRICRSALIDITNIFSIQVVMEDEENENGEELYAIELYSNTFNVITGFRNSTILISKLTQNEAYEELDAIQMIIDTQRKN